MFGFIERRHVFKPATREQAWMNPPAELRAEDVWFRLADGSSIHGWWCVPEGWQPSDGAVHYSHGNAGNLSQRGESVRRWMQALRRAVLIYDYPGFGASPGKPSEKGCYAAAEAVWSWMTGERRIALKEIIFSGGSLGGGVAVEMGMRHPYHALVLVSAFTSVPAMARKQYPWLPVRWAIRNRFENLEKIGRCPGRVFIAHGTADQYVPFSMGEQLFAAAREPKRFLPMVDFDHQHSPGPEFYAELVRFLEVTKDGV